MPVKMNKTTLEPPFLPNVFWRKIAAQITNAAYWLYYVYQIRQFEFDKGREWMRNRVEKNWHALIPQAKELIEEQYRGVTPRYESDRSEYL
jgi:hypothetical protein